jgi:putative selenium metabolism protein SsnA
MILKSATVVDIAPLFCEIADLRIEHDAIRERGALHPRPDEEVFDCSGKVILPGMVCAHTHLYSSLARGMPPPRRSPANFSEILKKIWWKLDEALDEEAIWYSALAGGIEAVKRGTTTLIDHHASPNCIPGSLNHVARALEKLGLRGVLCYETTDRGGRKRRDLGIAENERFVADYQDHPMFRGLFGAHASFTLEQKTVDTLGRLVQGTGSGIHIHVAEDRIDVSTTRKRFGRSVIERLRKAGALTDKSLLVHGVHLTGKELDIVDRTGAWLVHNPRSNMNNNVGHARLVRFPARTLLGTDGFPADMFEEARAGFFRCAEGPDRSASARILPFLAAGRELLSRLFDRPFGKLGPGSTADLIVLSYLPSTPMTEANVGSHVLFGMTGGDVESVMVEGRWIMINRHLKGVDEAFVMGEAQNVARRLWQSIS